MSTKPEPGKPAERKGSQAEAASAPEERRAPAARKSPLHVLVTAGPTREKIDEVRDWGNIFTGKTGLDLALAFLDLGSVTLLTSNETHAREFDGYSGKAGMLGVETFRSHADLLELLQERMMIEGGGEGGGVDVVAMTAAVADYRPSGVYRVVKREARNAKRETEGSDRTREIWEVENVMAAGGGKVKSTFDEIAVLGGRTLKLVDLFRTTWGFRGVLIKFKLEVGLSDAELLAVAGASRAASGADLMVANTLAMARGRGGENGRAGAYLIDDGGAVWADRIGLAGAITGWVRKRL